MRVMGVNLGASPGSSGTVGPLNVVSTWNTATQGALNTLAFRLDHALDPSTSASVHGQLLFGLRQGGTIYYHFGFFNTSNLWQTASISGLTSSDFNSTGFVNGPTPDLATGGVIEFGFFSSLLAVPGPADAVVLAENFCVVGNGSLTECASGRETPEPATAMLLGAALLGLGAVRRY